MQTSFSVPPQTNGLLAGAILEEYRDLVAQSLQAAKKRSTPTCQTSDSCGKQDSGQAGCCDRPKPKPSPKPKKRAMSWTDLPRA
jgi:hypothetical protein